MGQRYGIMSRPTWKKNWSPFKDFFLFIITKCYKTVSTDSFNGLAGIIPINIVVEFQQKFHNLIRKNINIIEEDLEIKNEEIQKTYCKIEPPWEFVKFPWKLAREEHYTYSDCQVIFTDGSKVKEKVGCAFVHIFQDKIKKIQTYRLSDNAWVFDTEALALDRAISYSRGMNFEKTKIFSDSRSVSMDIENIQSKNEIVIEIRKKLDFNIELFWIKAHIGIEGNELAKKGHLRRILIIIKNLVKVF